MRDRLQLTKKLVSELPEQDRITVAQARTQWWFNIRNTGGMRLTGPGYRVFSEVLDIESYEYTISDPAMFDQRMMLDLDRKIQMPYYISTTRGIPKKIIFFGWFLKWQACSFNRTFNLRPG